VPRPYRKFHDQTQEPCSARRYDAVELLIELITDRVASRALPPCGRSGADLSVPLLGAVRRVEVKARADGFRELYGWLADANLLIVRADCREPLVVIPFHLAIKIARAQRIPVSGIAPGVPGITRRMNANE